MRPLIRHRLLLLSIIATGISAVLAAYEKSLEIPLNHLDGAYQTASGLYRLAAGQWPGRDFFPYLGIGPLLSLFPLFFAAGSDMAASVFSSHLITSAVAILTAATCYYLAQPSRPSPLHSLVFGGIYLIIAYQLTAHFPSATYDVVSWSLEPGNSLRPIRAFLPFLAAAALLYVSHRTWSHFQHAVSYGLIASASILWSNDYAYVTAGGVLVWAWVHSQRRATAFAMTLGVFCIGASTFYFAATGGQPVSMLQYNFLDVAKDQWWYFAPWDDAYRVYSTSDLIQAVSWHWLIPLTATIVITKRLRANNTLGHRLLLWLGAMLLAGGTIATLGGHIDRYFSPMYQWGTLVLVVHALGNFRLFIEKRFPNNPRDWIRTSVVVWAATLGVMNFASASSGLYLEKKLLTSGELHYFYVKELGGYLPNSWQSYVTFARQDVHPIVVEEYWGIFSAIRRVFPPLPVDSVIHALGKQREAATKAIGTGANTLFIVSRYGNFHKWQPWNISANYWFYQPLLERGHIVGRFPATLALTSSKTHKFIDHRCIVNSQGNRFSLPGATAGYYEISLDSVPIGPGRHLFMVDNRIVFAANAAGWLSLDPNLSNHQFPVYIDDPAYPSFPVEVRPQKTGAKVVLTRCSARRITHRNEDILPLPLLFSDRFYENQGEWQSGYSTHEPTFYLPNLERHREVLAAAKQVQLPGGETRNILGFRPAGNRLVVHVSGTPINSHDIGYPTKLRFLN